MKYITSILLLISVALSTGCVSNGSTGSNVPANPTGSDVYADTRVKVDAGRDRASVSHGDFEIYKSRSSAGVGLGDRNTALGALDVTTEGLRWNNGIFDIRL